MTHSAVADAFGAIEPSQEKPPRTSGDALHTLAFRSVIKLPDGMSTSSNHAARVPPVSARADLSDHSLATEVGALL